MKAVVEDKKFVGKERAQRLENCAKFKATLSEVESSLKRDLRFSRFQVGRGGSHVWVSLKNGRRVAVVMEE